MKEEGEGGAVMKEGSWVALMGEESMGWGVCCVEGLSDV